MDARPAAGWDRASLLRYMQRTGGKVPKELLGGPKPEWLSDSQWDRLKLISREATQQSKHKQSRESEIARPQFTVTTQLTSKETVKDYWDLVCRRKWPKARRCLIYAITRYGFYAVKDELLSVGKALSALSERTGLDLADKTQRQRLLLKVSDFEENVVKPFRIPPLYFSSFFSSFMGSRVISTKWRTVLVEP
jgi:hypothetical protein